MTETDAPTPLQSIDERLARMERSNRFNEIWSVGLGLRNQVSFALMLLGVSFFLPNLTESSLTPEWVMMLVGYAIFVYALFATLATFALRRHFVRRPEYVDEFMRDFTQDFDDFEKSLFHFLLERHDTPKHIHFLKQSLSIVRWIERHAVWVVLLYLIITIGFVFALRYWLS